MAMNRRTARILGAAAAGTAALVTLRELKKVRHRKEEERQAAIDAALVRNRDYGSRRAYLIGGGLASMAAAAYLIRDCNFPGSHITIYEGTHILGGGNDGAGTPEKGYVCRGGHMLNEETYENFWELFDTIPSLKKTGQQRCRGNSGVCPFSFRTYPWTSGRPGGNVFKCKIHGL